MTANNWGHSQSIHVERIIRYSGEMSYLDFLFLEALHFEEQIFFPLFFYTVRLFQDFRLEFLSM